MKRSPLISILLALALAGTALGASLRSYENRVKRASEQIERIKVDHEYAEQGIDAVRELVPRNVAIDYDGKTVNVDNTWLYVLLDTFEAETDPQQRVAKLNELEGRLTALDSNLVRAEEDAEARKTPPDPRKKIEEILSGPEYRAKQESRVGAFFKEIWRRIKAFLSELLEALGRLLGKIFGATAGGNWLAIVFLILALGAAGYIIFRIVNQVSPRRKRRRRRIVLGEEIESGTSPKDLADAAMAAARAGDFRGAIRKLYISLLYDLAERNMLELDDSVTNREYLLKLAQYSALIPPIEYLTNRFDYCWYGMAPSSEQEFDQFRARYNEAMQSAEKLAAAPA